MAEFQLPGPATDVSKILYGKNRSLYGEPKPTVQFRDVRSLENLSSAQNSIITSRSTFSEQLTMRDCAGKKISYCRLGLPIQTAIFTI